MRTISRARRRLLVCLAAGAAVLAIGLAPGHAFAGLSGCDLDPVVTLSNGMRLTIATHVTDASSDVQTVAYTLHLPVGVSVSSLTYVDGLGVNETVDAYSDQRYGSYLVSAVAYTGIPNVAVGEQVTMTRYRGEGQGRPLYGTAAGVSGQPVTVQLRQYGDD